MWGGPLFFGGGDIPGFLIVVLELGVYHVLSARVSLSDDASLVLDSSRNIFHMSYRLICVAHYCVATSVLSFGTKKVVRINSTLIAPIMLVLCSKYAGIIDLALY